MSEILIHVATLTTLVLATASSLYVIAFLACEMLGVPWDTDHDLTDN